MKTQTIGVEIEMTGITREEAAQAVAKYFGTEVEVLRDGYGSYGAEDNQGRMWKFSFDRSILAQKNFQQFKYIPRQHIGYTFEIADDVPKNLPKDYEEIYMALLDNYSQNELEEYRNLYGNEILRELYRQEFGVQFDNL